MTKILHFIASVYRNSEIILITAIRESRKYAKLQVYQRNTEVMNRKIEEKPLHLLDSVFRIRPTWWIVDKIFKYLYISNLKNKNLEF